VCYFEDDLRIALFFSRFPTQADIAAYYRLRKHLYGRPISCNLWYGSHNTRNEMICQVCCSNKIWKYSNRIATELFKYPTFSLTEAMVGLFIWLEWRMEATRDPSFSSSYYNALGYGRNFCLHSKLHASNDNGILIRFYEHDFATMNVI